MAIELEDGRPPEWMIALENKRKRQHKLAHDIGAGAPCLNCSDGCTGLDLHFWRKICRNCKCKKEVHDVKEENTFEQFEILFGDKLKNNDRIKKISLDMKFKLADILASRDAPGKDTNSATKSENDLLFDWIPADVPVNLASEYLQQLPLEKIPITGSAGAMFRRQQLQKQIPLHDFKVNTCHDLTDEETVAFTDYVDNLKTNAVGKGRITKVPDASAVTNDHYPFNSPLLPNNLNASPKPFKGFTETKSDPVAEDDEFPPPPSDFLLPTTDLKTPSAFVPYRKVKTIHPKAELKNNDVPYTTEDISCNKFVESSSPVVGLSVQYSEKLKINEKNAENDNWCPNRDENTVEEKLTPSEIIRKLNSQKAVAKPSENGRNALIRSYNRNTNIIRNASPSKNIDGKFVKITNPEEFVAVSSYVPNVPQVCNTLKGLKNPAKSSQIILGTPMAYPNPMCVNSLAPIPNVNLVCEMCCHQCKQEIVPGQVAVIAERAGVEVIWHPQCFVCIICQELLVDLVYFFHRGEVYCGRHYADVLKIPRCFACDELIFVKEYTVAEHQTFHVKHFCCFECDVPLAGKQYIPKDKNPICVPCYEAKYGKQCDYCGKMIRAGDSRVSWMELSWHATDSCFKCIQCSKSLLGGKFVVKKNKPLCSKECVMKFDRD